MKDAILRPFKVRIATLRAALLQSAEYLEYMAKKANDPAALMAVQDFRTLASKETIT